MTKKNPRPFTTGDLTILQNQLKIFNLLFINHVLVRNYLKQGYRFFNFFLSVQNRLQIRSSAFLYFAFFNLIFNDIFAPLLLGGNN